MKKLLTLVVALASVLTTTLALAQSGSEGVFTIRGFTIGSPKPKDLDRFIKFINDELVTRKVNTLVLRVNFNYEFQSYPKLRDSVALSRADVNRIVDACAKGHIRIIPQLNLLGHQSWSNHTNNLLRLYPEFDETPNVKMPEVYAWPNADGLYCKSYCPLHPDVHKVVFALMDELCDAFNADAFHAGMDEVFYLASDQCPRCSGMDPSVIFGGEVTAIRDHLAVKNRELWIWGDRLIDGKATGIGFWEASYNNTQRAVDLIPKDVVICDWHYERPDQTAVYFAMKGFRVLTCPWRRPAVAIAQAEDMARFRKSATPVMKGRYYGIMQTVWSAPEGFLDGFYGLNTAAAAAGVSRENKAFTPWDTFRTLYKRMDELNKQAP